MKVKELSLVVKKEGPQTILAEGVDLYSLIEEFKSQNILAQLVQVNGKSSGLYLQYHKFPRPLKPSAKTHEQWFFDVRLRLTKEYGEEALRDDQKEAFPELVIQAKDALDYLCEDPTMSLKYIEDIYSDDTYIIRYSAPGLKSMNYDEKYKLFTPFFNQLDRINNSKILKNLRCDFSIDDYVKDFKA